ncbi:RDD family protein, partial [bacterium]|nr:RDD family protein [bacterium]
MAREVVLMTPEQVEVRFELAGIGSRFIALLIDTLWQGLCILIPVVLLIAFGFVSTPSLSNFEGIMVFALFVLLIFVITNGYFLYFETTKNGQTPGKKAVGIRVILDSGHPVDFRAALIRNVMRLVDMLPSMYGVGIVSAFFSPQYRRLGDYVGGTMVVKVGRTADAMATRPQPAVESEAVYKQQQSLLPPEAMPLITSIDKEEYRTIRHFLDRRAELEIPV